MSEHEEQERPEPTDGGGIDDGAVHTTMVEIPVELDSDLYMELLKRSHDELPDSVLVAALASHVLKQYVSTEVERQELTRMMQEYMESQRPAMVRSAQVVDEEVAKNEVVLDRLMDAYASDNVGSDTRFTEDDMRSWCSSNLVAGKVIRIEHADRGPSSGSVPVMFYRKRGSSDYLSNKHGQAYFNNMCVTNWVPGLILVSAVDPIDACHECKSRPISLGAPLREPCVTCLYGPNRNLGIDNMAEQFEFDRAISLPIRDKNRTVRVQMDELIDAVDSGRCTLSGPGRGDCQNFTGLPGESIPGAHDGEDDTVDAYGKPNGWCWSCWKSHQLAQVLKRTHELEREAVALKEEAARHLIKLGSDGGD